VQEHATVFLLEPTQERTGLLRRDVGDPPLRLWEIRLIGLLDITDEPTVEALDARVAG
jgi:hypothetical protein